MRRSLAVVAAASTILLLAGCTGITTEVKHDSITITPGQTGTFTNGDTTIVVGGDATGAPTDEAGFVADVRGGLTSGSAVASATDAQLIASGDAVCAELEKGVDPDKIVVTVGGATLIPGDDATTIITAAQEFLCS